MKAEYRLEKAPVCSALELSRKLWTENEDKTVNDDVYVGDGVR